MTPLYPGAMRLLSIWAAAAAAALGACGSDAARESGFVELTFEVGSAGADGDGTVSDAIAIASLPGDPWRAFVAASRDTLGGDPGDVSVEDLRLRLDPTSAGVADLADVFHGPVALDLELDASGDRYDVAEALLDADELGSEAALAPRLRWSDIPADHRAAVLAGSFDALFVGHAGTSFREGDATAVLVIEATFVATP